MNLKEAVTKYGYAILVTMLLAGSLFLDSPVYICEGNDPPVRECLKLSSTGRTCYFDTGRDICPDGKKWLKIEGNEFYGHACQSVRIKANNKEWDCEVVDGFVEPYTKCKSSSSEGYLGEFI
ncbi:MAG: hypothetical protein ACTSSP_05600 [Candidatus Asgardarchaeia archaeon]